MTIKRNNAHLLLFAIGNVVLSGVLAKLSWGLGNVIAYAVFVGMGLLLLAGQKDGTKVLDVLPFHVGLKPLTALFIVLLPFAMMPLSILCSNLCGSLGGDILNKFAGSLQTGSKSFLEQFVITAVVPVIFEEIFFRGFFYAGFKRRAGARTAIIVTAILFGLAHMALQQLLYIVVMGLVLAYLREVTGSMWAGMLYHFVNNAYSSVVNLLGKDYTFITKLPIARVSFLTEGNTTGNLIHSIAMLVICLPIAGLIIYAIAKQENRVDDLKRFFKPKAGVEKDDVEMTDTEKKAVNEQGKIVTPCFVWTLIFYLFVIVISFVITKFFPNLLDESLKTFQG